MNKVILIGRLTRAPEIRYSQGEQPICVARWSLAVDRRYKRQGEQEADFINCLAFGKTAEFVEKYLNKGTKIAVFGRIQTGSYTNRDGQKVYTTEVVAEELEFAESKNAQGNSQQPQQNQGGFSPQNASGFVPQPASGPADGFMNIPDGIDEELPFN